MDYLINTICSLRKIPADKFTVTEWRYILIPPVLAFIHLVYSFFSALYFFYNSEPVAVGVDIPCIYIVCLNFINTFIEFVPFIAIILFVACFIHDCPSKKEYENAEYDVQKYTNLKHMKNSSPPFSLAVVIVGALIKGFLSGINFEVILFILCYVGYIVILFLRFHNHLDYAIAMQEEKKPK